jgi:integrase
MVPAADHRPQYSWALALPLLVRESSPSDPRPPKLLDRVRAAIRARHYSRRTEKAYVAWIRRYIFFHDKRHPADMGAPEVTRFLSSLAVDRKVAASTQNQALSALLFLYGEVLGVDLPWMNEIVLAKRPQRLPVVLTRDEVGAALRRLEGTPRVMAFLLYGPGSGSSSAAASASRTWISGRTRSSCGAARATRTA